jgi:integrase
MRTKYPNPGTRATTIAALHAAAQGLDMDEEAKLIHAFMLAYSADYKQIRQTNEPNAKLASVGLEVFPWTEFREKVEKMTSYDADHALLAMYVLLPVRRLEFRHLVFYEKPPLTPDPTEARPRVARVNVDGERHDPTTGVAWNYVYAKDGGGMRMVLRTYKTSTNLGVYVVDLPPELVDVLERYLAKSGKGDGDFLFSMPRKKNQPYSQSGFTQLVQKTVKKYSGIDANIGIRELRSARVTANRDEERPNYLEKERLARAMGHGVDTAEASYLVRTTRPIGAQAGPSGSGAGPSAPRAPPQAPPANLRSYQGVLEEIAFLKSRLEDVEALVRRMMAA